jgi:hypothetical protein
VARPTLPEGQTAKGSYEERSARISAALKAKLGDPWATGGTHWYVKATFEDGVIVEVGGELKRYPLTVDKDGDVTIGTPADAEVIYKVVAEALAGGKRIAAGGGMILGPIPVTNADKLTEAEKKEKAGLLWAAVAIQAGVSQNRNYYPEATLRAAAPLYEGAKVFVNHELRTDVMRDPGGLIGRFREAKYATVEGADGTKVGAVVGTLKVTSRSWRERMIEASEAGELDLYGLSHTIVNPVTQNVRLADGPASRVDKITAVESLDVVSFPSAGGRLMKMVAGMSSPVPVTEEGLMKFAEKLAKLQEGAPDLAKALSAQPTEAEVDALLRVMEGRAAATPPTPPAAPAATPATPPPAPKADAAAGAMSDADRALLVEFRQSRRASMVEAAISGVQLPEVFKSELREALLERQDLTPEIAQAAVAKKVQVVAKATEGFRGIGFGGGAVLEAGADVDEKSLHLLDDLMMTDASPAVLKAYEKIAGRKAQTPDSYSVKEAYVKVTGDTRILNGRAPVREGLRPMRRFDALMAKRMVEGRRIVEGTLQTTTWAEVFGDSVARRMLAEYRADPGMDAWRQIANVVPLPDFRNQHRIRWGGYGDFPIVAENAGYEEAVTPGDEEITYRAQKRGYIEKVTWEAMVNDDLGQIRQVPVRIGRAASRTLFKFVTITNLAGNPTMDYDATALFAGGHNNIITNALSPSEIVNARKKLASQSDMSGNEKLNFYPNWLMVHPDNEELGFRITSVMVALTSNQNATEASFIRSLGLNSLIVNPYLSDANDWFVGADKGQASLVEIGFLFGQEEPTLIIADQQNQGEYFTADKIAYKPRHVYGGDAVDHRPAVGGIVP